MQKSFPKITIVLATYQSNFIWLRELLESLRKQTYPNYEVLICDDFSDPEIYKGIRQIAEKELCSVSYQICQNQINMGSNKTFERLTDMAEGDYIAYCDQDDIWEKEKLEILYREAIKKDAVMVYSDMSIIDEKGRVCYRSLKQLRRRIRYRAGADLTAYYLFSNCSAGCSMMIKSSVAKRAIPFLKEFVCDQWLAVYAAASGTIGFVKKTLVRYRQHNRNQSGVLKDIDSQEKYYQKRILPSWYAVKELEKRGIHYKGERQSKAFAKARIEQNIKEIWKYRFLCRKYAYFEILVCYIKKEKVSSLLNRIRER